MSDWAGIAWLVVLLAFNAFFVGAEFAVISARRSQIEPLAEKGSKTAVTALYAMEHATLMLATSQLGITICSLLILNVSSRRSITCSKCPLGLTGWNEAVIGGVAFAIALVLVSYLHVVFGEMVPKNLAFSLPDRAVLMLATPLVWTSKLFYPIIVGAQLAGQPHRAPVPGRAEERGGVDVHPRRGGHDREPVTDRGCARRRFRRRDGRAGVHRQEGAGRRRAPVGARDAPETTTPDEIERAVAKHGFSRYVIVDAEGIPLGYVHLKDVLRAAEGAGADEKVAVPIKPKRIHHMVPVAETTDLEDALALMRRTSRHLAQVRNAQGETTAVLFLEDIIEELVGEVHDATRRGY
jgi:CBS domain containing-hemolysin-like protein